MSVVSKASAWWLVAWGYFRRYGWLVLLAIAFIAVWLLKVGKTSPPKKLPGGQQQPPTLPPETEAEVVRRLQEKVDSATIDIRIERERARAKTESERKVLQDIKAEREPRKRQERLSSWLEGNL